MDINATLLIQMLIFMSFVGLTMHCIWPPIHKVLDKRRQVIEKGLKQAEAAKIMLTKAEQEVKDLLLQARLQGEELLEKMRLQADTILANAKAEAEHERQAIVERTEQDIDQYIKQRSDEISLQMVRLSLAAAEKLMAEKMTSEQDQAFVRRVLEQMDD